MSFTNRIETDVADVYRAVLSETTDDAFVVAPAAASVERLVTVLDGLDSPPTVRLLAFDSTLKDVLDDFLVASTAADLIDEGTLSLGTIEEAGTGQLIVTDDTVVSLVTAGQRVAALGTDDEEFVANANERSEERWDASSSYSLRTPPLSRIRETMAEAFDPGVRDDFDAVLASLDTARGDGNGLDEVTISLLVAAKNEELLYDISKWGEDTGVASKATFSRTKTRLEEMGLLDTTKVPIDVGRPRLRLLLGDERLSEADADELAAVATGILSTDAS
ncbi:transcriptional regulator TbsP [Halococcus thailandensis]|uniref:Transcriptional regulator n=1 Tax=Halococcus thailandensis JCM 13552 TaxID=1227457 RepID=M0N360_9EURY|nr:DUF5821 family protein [Halococcus thailandensis]EMA51130.1 hypothetical protein C451_15588 [Halococcus thailandensis JCM 13552]